ncbi:hypothetical protein OHA72_52780 [Dactylosporangium sp. NBC_01737]|uniref:hypothetical protein n=1 Tax=Dactylosporangium sp. NBC_01737 TaxID=2975959 RepID=UPI002E0EB36C|nr:hypothetical protein OHA72_52780 [Dactylosporangium sp. NBC_01737]
MSSFTTPPLPAPPISRARKRAAVLTVAATAALCCAALVATRTVTTEANPRDTKPYRKRVARSWMSST